MDTRGLNAMGRRLLSLPAPQYVVFYSGAERQPERQEMRLSDLYGGREAAVEVVATVINVNKGCNEGIKEHCRALADYAEFVSRIRRASEIMSLEDAVGEAVDSCIRDDVMGRYLSAHRAEVTDMFRADYDMDYLHELIRRDAYEEGCEAGREAGTLSARADLVANLMGSMSLTFDQACDALGIPASDRGSMEPASRR